MRVDWEQKEKYIKWLEEQLHVTFIPGYTSWLTQLDSNSEIVSVIAYTQFSPFNCEVSIALNSSKQLSREFLSNLFAYPFLQCGLRRITATIKHTNTKSINFVQRLGFQNEGVLFHLYGEGEHGLIFGLLKENCKWL